MYRATTRGIQITVQSQYLPEQSSLAEGQYAFAYTVHISNLGSVPAQLLSRHWIITDADGKVQEVRGEGVVGVKPKLNPGEHFEYTSWCLIASPPGYMRGSYQMVSGDGEDFEAEIPAFRLALPHSLN